MSHFITTNNSDGRAVFSSKVPVEHVELPMNGGIRKIIYSTHDFPANLSTEADIDQYAQDRMHGLPGDRVICPEHGSAVSLITLEPNCVSALHRTMTLDVIVIMEGAVELHLDSGEKRVMKAGDTVTQRATMHKWVNVTPNDGVCKLFGVGLAIVEPLEIAGRKLEADFEASKI